MTLLSRHLPANKPTYTSVDSFYILGRKNKGVKKIYLIDDSKISTGRSFYPIPRLTAALPKTQNCSRTGIEPEYAWSQVRILPGPLFLPFLCKIIYRTGTEPVFARLTTININIMVKASHEI
jgi:hypothetical protein